MKCEAKLQRDPVDHSYLLEHLNKAHASDKLFKAHRILPTPSEHASRNDFQIQPIGRLIETGKVVQIAPRPFGPRKIFRDSVTGIDWVKEPWYLNIFHEPWRNVKFLALDRDVIEGAEGSSECQVPKKSREVSADGFESYDIGDKISGSYNYRTRGIAHFPADILPVGLYCNNP